MVCMRMYAAFGAAMRSPCVYHVVWGAQGQPAVGKLQADTENSYVRPSLWGQVRFTQQC